jgi:hypothetical protein
MKRLLIVLAILLTVIDVVSAQQWGNNGGYSQNITVTGTLQLQNGTITIVNGNNIYYVPTLERYIGFIDGLKEGTQVSLEGYNTGNGNYIQPSRLTINGKNYDFNANTPRTMSNNNYSYGRNNARYGNCCGGWGWYDSMDKI